MDSVVQKGEKILVHNHAGRSRSVVVVVAYFMVCDGHTVESAGLLLASRSFCQELRTRRVNCRRYSGRINTSGRKVPAGSRSEPKVDNLDNHCSDVILRAPGPRQAT